MSLLPSQFRNQDPLPALGHKIVPPATKKPDPIRDFETGHHSIDGSVIRRVMDETFFIVAQDLPPNYREDLMCQKMPVFVTDPTMRLDWTATVDHKSMTAIEVLAEQEMFAGKLRDYQRQALAALRPAVVKDERTARNQAKAKYADRFFELKSLGFSFSVNEMLNVVNPVNIYTNRRPEMTTQAYRDAQQWLEEKAVEAVEAGYLFDIESASFTKG
jgi:hypothetical protein